MNRAKGITPFALISALILSATRFNYSLVS